MLIFFIFSFLISSSKCELTIDNYVLANTSGYCDELIIPKNVIRISRTSIQNVENYLRKVVFTSNKITQLCPFQFYNCIHLQEINLEALTELKEIPMRCFLQDSSLLTIRIPSKVKTLSAYCFMACTNLYEVIFENDSKLGFIQAYSFYETKIRYFEFPNSIIRIFDHALGKCLRLQTISIAGNSNLFSINDDVLFNKEQTKLIYYPSGSQKRKYIVPNTVITICETAFHEVPALIELIIPDSVLEIEFKGIQKLINLRSFTLSKNIQNVYDGAISYFESIKFLNFSQCTQMRIHQRFCKGCTNLEEIILPTNLNSIGEEGFLLCPSLNCVHAPERVIEIIKTLINTSYITFFPNDAINVKIKIIKKKK